jgi:hypothetical protein
MTAATTRPMAPAILAALPRWLRRPTMPQAPTSRPRTSAMTPSPSVQAAEIVPTNGAIAVAQGRRAPTTSRAHAPSRMWKRVPVLTRPPSPFLAGGGGGGAAPGWMVPMGSPLSGGAGCPRRPPPSAGTSGRECLMLGGALERLAAEGPAPARGGWPSMVHSERGGRASYDAAHGGPRWVASIAVPADSGSTTPQPPGALVAGDEWAGWGGS